MTKTELIENLDPFFMKQDQITAEIYFILKKDDTTELKFANLESSAQRELREQFLEYIKKEIIDNNDISVIKISKADDRVNTIYEYDLDKIPHELSVIDEVISSESIEQFSFKKDKLDNIRGFVIFIANTKTKLVLYKKHYPVSLYKKDSSFSLYKNSDESMFVRLQQDILKINSSFEFFKLNNTLLIKDLKVLEKFFGFHDVIKVEAEKSIVAIENKMILDNPNELRSMLKDITFARKLTKIAKNSPVLANKIPTSSIIAFSEKHPAIKGRIRFNENKSKIHLDTKISKQLFVKLLNDDFLISQLTKMYYDSLAKDNIKAENETEEVNLNGRED